MFKKLLLPLLLIPSTLVLAGAHSPAQNDPVILYAAEGFELEVVGDCNLGNKSACKELEQQIRTAVEKRLSDAKIPCSSPNRTSSERPPHLAILFRITADGPQSYNAHIWIEVYDQATHTRTGKTIKAHIHGCDHVVVGATQTQRNTQLVDKATQETDRLISLYHQGASRSK